MVDFNESTKHPSWRGVYAVFTNKIVRSVLERPLRQILIADLLEMH